MGREQNGFSMNRDFSTEGCLVQKKEKMSKNLLVKSLAG